ncbi:hypothetical protein [Enterobacter soli]|uniref:hypothetical protein n=1 Tax=Enterobacter soli TaxID=885040 RepID=UPI0037341299
MTTQITILNKQADNLLIYIEKYKAKFEERLVAYNAVGQLEWNAGSWHFGEKGVAWLKETKDRGFKWDEVSSRAKGLSQMNIIWLKRSLIHLQGVKTGDRSQVI